MLPRLRATGGAEGWWRKGRGESRRQCGDEKHVRTLISRSWPDGDVTNLVNPHGHGRLVGIGIQIARHSLVSQSDGDRPLGEHDDPVCII
jgi:hypothetical protein